jgi:CBS domain-containing protein
MNVGQCMSTNVHICSPDDTLQMAANAMREIEAGALLVGENDRLVGVITDRDIAVRAVAEGRLPDTPIREAMSGEIHYCFEDQDIQEVADKMAEQKIRRLAVLNRDKRLVGTVSLGDIVRADGKAAEAAFEKISELGGPHQQ